MTATVLRFLGRARPPVSQAEPVPPSPNPDGSEGGTDPSDPPTCKEVAAAARLLAAKEAAGADVVAVALALDTACGGSIVRINAAISAAMRDVWAATVMARAFGEGW